MKRLVAVESRINTMWTMVFEVVSDTELRLLKFGREMVEGYTQKLPRGELLEMDSPPAYRTVVGAIVDGKRYTVVNPGYVFSYDSDATTID